MFVTTNQGFGLEDHFFEIVPREAQFVAVGGGSGRFALGDSALKSARPSGFKSPSSHFFLIRHFPYPVPDRGFPFISIEGGGSPRLTGTRQLEDTRAHDGFAQTRDVTTDAVSQSDDR